MNNEHRDRYARGFFVVAKSLWEEWPDGEVGIEVFRHLPCVCEGALSDEAGDLGMLKELDCDSAPHRATIGDDLVGLEAEP